jgi:hypothetical protein
LRLAVFLGTMPLSQVQFEGLQIMISNPANYNLQTCDPVDSMVEGPVVAVVGFEDCMGYLSSVVSPCVQATDC